MGMFKNAAKVAGGTGLVSGAVRVSDLTSPSVKETVTNKLMENPDGSGYSILPHLEKVVKPGLNLMDAVSQAAPVAMRDAAIAAATYVGYKGLKHVLGRQYKK
jgi:hypothetical protein